MRVTFWGCRGSIASAGPETVRHGGNTACVAVTGRDGSALVLDAGTGLRRLGIELAGRPRVDILLTHLHMDHIQGLGFFRPFFEPGAEVHVWGPPSTTEDLRTRLTRYLSPPFFPVRINDLPSRAEFHDAPEAWDIDGMRIESAAILHPGPTLGYRITAGGSSVAYLSDHEPALGGSDEPRWTSGYGLAAGADLLIHDAQYTDEEYPEHVGWGHSSVSQTVDFARRAEVRRLALFHHDPDHDDDAIDAILDSAQSLAPDGLHVTAAREGESVEV